MSDSTHHHSHADSHIEPAEGASPADHADELLAHGLLGFLHTDNAELQSRRVERVMQGLRAEEPSATASVRRAAGRMRLPIRTIRNWTAIAASIGLITAVSILAVPRESAAQAAVRNSIAALRGPGDRRFEVRITTWVDEETASEPHAIVDTRPPSLMVIRAKRPGGVEGTTIVGRDMQSRWAIRLDGAIERDHPERAWPRFAALENQSLFAESIDQMLDEMSRVYELTRATDERSETGVVLKRIDGVRRMQVGPGPSEVSIWIDEQTKLVDRMELRWDERDRRRFEEAPPPPPGMDIRRGPDDFRRPRGGPPRDGDRGPRPMGRPPLGPRGPDDAGPRGPMHRGDSPPRGGPDDFGADGPPPPPPRPDFDGPPDEGGPEGERPDDRGPDVGPREHDDRPPMDRPHGPRGPRDDTHRPFRPMGERGPENPGGPMFRPPPPKKIVIQRVEAPSFDNSWFSPEAHVGTDKAIDKR